MRSSRWTSMKTLMILMTLVIGFFLSMSASSAFAQDESEGTGTIVRTPAQEAAAAKTEKKKTLNFEDELVEGATQKPELFYLFQKKNFNYKRLIKLRENFLPEMRQTSEELQRVRSSN